MRHKYQRAPITTEWTVGADANTGDGIVAAEKLGAALELMEDSWWGPTVPLVGAPWFALSERNSPGSIIVNVGGQPVHERVDALCRGGPPHVWRPLRPGRRSG
ncbi:MAG: FAD-binding protein [Paludibaculum sp.]